jgi:hypothetical protein
MNGVKYPLYTKLIVYSKKGGKSIFPRKINGVLWEKG